MYFERFAARWLVDSEKYVRALVWAANDDELADELWIDRPMLSAWRDCMTDEERAYVDEHSGDAEKWGAA